MDAFSFQGSEAIKDRAGNIMIAAQPGAGMQLLRKLRENYGAENQESEWMTLASFFKHRRSADLLTYLTTWELLYDQAVSEAKLHISDVGKSYLVLEHSGLTPSKVDDIRLHLDGDMSQFKKLLALLYRMAKQDGAAESATPNLMRTYHADGWGSAGYTGDSHDAPCPDQDASCDGEVYHDCYWYDSEQGPYYDDGEYYEDGECSGYYDSDPYTGEAYWLEDEDPWESEAAGQFWGQRRKGGGKGSRKGNRKGSFRKGNRKGGGFRRQGSFGRRKGGSKGKGYLADAIATPEQQAAIAQAAEAAAQAQPANADVNASYKAKGKSKGGSSKGKGSGCETCGSAWHRSDVCPVKTKGFNGLCHHDTQQPLAPPLARTQFFALNAVEDPDDAGVPDDDGWQETDPWSGQSLGEPTMRSVGSASTLAVDDTPLTDVWAEWHETHVPQPARSSRLAMFTQSSSLSETSLVSARSSSSTVPRGHTPAAHGLAAPGLSSGRAMSSSSASSRPMFSRNLLDDPPEPRHTAPVVSDRLPGPPGLAKRSLFAAAVGLGAMGFGSGLQGCTVMQPQFHFMNFEANESQKAWNEPAAAELAFHVVRGTKRHGLLVDPGASAGIIGADTLREYVESCLKPRNKAYKVMESNSSFSGIDGQVDSGKSKVIVPLDVPGLGEWSFAADVIGNKGAFCPALLPNSSLRAFRMTLYTNIFHDGDGILAVAPQQGQNGTLIRVLLTESGHYLLPIDGKNSAPDPAEQKLMKSLVKRYTEELLSSSTSSKAPSSRACKTLYAGDKTPRVGSSEDIRTSCNDTPLHEDKGPSRQDTPCREDITSTKDFSSCNDTPLREESSTGKTETSIRGRSLNKQPNISKRSTSCPASTAQSPPQSCLKRESTPVGRAKNVSFEDTASRDSGLASPRATGTTSGQALHSSNFSRFFTAWMAFSAPCYSSDVWPQHFDAQRQASSRQYYKAMPEHFYSRTKLPVVTPENMNDFLNHMQGHQLVMHEVFSGSGMLSLEAWNQGLPCGFPIDHRYGWDINVQQHRQLMDKAIGRFKPRVLFFSPRCSPWCKLSKQVHGSSLQKRRAVDLPALEWMASLMEAPQRTYKCIVEQPEGSAMLTESPVHRCVGRSEYNSTKIFQCTYGAVAECGTKVRKATVFLADLDLRQMFRTCKCAAHAQLQGNVPGTGIARTAAAAVYPKALCSALLKQIATSMPEMIHWSCARCRFGNACVEDHTLEPGKCKHACRPPKLGPPLRPVPAPVPEADDAPSAPGAGSSTDTAGGPPDDVVVNESSSGHEPCVRVKPNIDAVRAPNFDLKYVLNKLSKSNEEVSVNEKLKLLVGIHVRFYHSNVRELARMLKAGGAHPQTLKLVPRVPKCCGSCKAHALPLSAPRLKASISTFFGANVVTDIFFIRKRMYVIFVDECTRYKVAARLHSKDAEEWKSILLNQWIRYFGAPKRLTSDQEGAVIAETTAAALERFNISLSLAGSEGHTGAALAESHIRLLKLTTYKLLEDCRMTGMKVDQDDLVIEAAMACNLMLSYNGHCPAEAVLGFVPRDPYDHESESLLAHTGILEDREDIFERSLRLRLLAKEAILAAIVQDRLVKANNTLTQAADVTALTVGSDVDMYRPPTTKGNSGWSGPHELVHISADKSKVVVLVKSQPLLIPIRHIRLHQPIKGFIDHYMTPIYDNYQLASPHPQCSASAHEAEQLQFSSAMVQMVEYCEGLAIGGVRQIGRSINEAGQVIYHPPDLVDKPPPIWGHVTNVATNLYGWSKIDGFVCGNGCPRTCRVYGATQGLCLLWARTHREHYMLTELKPNIAHTISSISTKLDRSPFDLSYIMFYRYDIADTDSDGLDTWITDVNVSDIDMSNPPGTSPSMSSIPVDDESMDRWLGGLVDEESDDDDHRPPYPPGLPPGSAPVPSSGAGIAIPYNPSSSPSNLLPNHQPGDINMVPTDVSVVETPQQVTPMPLPEATPLQQQDMSSEESATISMESDLPQEAVADPSVVPVPKSKGHVDELPDFDPTASSSHVPGNLDPDNHVPLLPTVPEENCPLPSQPQAQGAPPSSQESLDEEDVSTCDYGSDTKENFFQHCAKNPGRRSVVTGYAEMSEISEDLEMAQSLVFSMLSCPGTPMSCPLTYIGDAPRQCWNVNDSHLVIPGAFRHSQCFWFALATAECFSVSSSDVLSQADVATYWPQVEQADRDELKNFVTHKVFSAKRYDRERMSNTIDMTWVRRWKRTQDMSGKTVWVVKSRLCGRGFLDRQKQDVHKHSSTASRLSHRLLCSIGVQTGFSFELYDISCAFLQGLEFSKMHKMALELGVELPAQRAIYVAPPPNVWRHFRELGAKDLSVPSQAVGLYVLECLKAIYGLVDAPMLWQMALTFYLKKELGGLASSFDDNCIFWISGNCVELIVTIHVDDLLVTGTSAMMSWLHKKLESRFGKTKRETMPFVHLGVKHQLLPSGSLFLDQEEYVRKIPRVAIDMSRSKLPDSTPLNPTEHHAFRSLLCSMLWVTVTRIDMCFEVIYLQSSMVTPTMGDLKAANALLAKSVRNAHLNGLHFPRIQFPVRLNAIHDASHATKKSSYAYEGLVILLMHDAGPYTPGPKGFLPADQGYKWAGYGQPIVHSSRKSKRVSNSTSHGETLSAINAAQLVNLIALRYTEVYCISTFGRTPSTKFLLHLQTNNLAILPCDLTTDCMDLYELVCGLKGIPSDKSQRLCVLCLREDRLNGRVRMMAHMPTANMLADGLTKGGIFAGLLEFCTTGVWRISKLDQKPIRLKMPAPRREEISEHDLVNMTE